MNKIILLKCIVFLFVVSAWSGEKDDVILAKADKACAARAPVPARGPVSMKAGFADYCGVLRDIKSELAARENPKDIAELKRGRLTMAKLIAQGNTPDVKDAEKLCSRRLPEGFEAPEDGPYVKAVEKMQGSCRLLGRAKRAVARQAKLVPRRMVYYSNCAAIRVTAVSVVTIESAWRLMEIMEKEKKPGE